MFKVIWGDGWCVRTNCRAVTSSVKIVELYNTTGSQENTDPGVLINAFLLHLTSSWVNAFYIVYLTVMIKYLIILFNFSTAKVRHKQVIAPR